jgi:ABC-2 type transport system ATP-binding protein
MKKIIEFQKIQKKYNQKIIIQDTDFSIGEKEIIGLVGANGAGKTTLMRILVGLTKRYSGKVYSDLDSPKIGCVIESPNFYTYMTGYQNLMYFSNYTESSKQEVVELLNMMGLGDAADKKVKAYSLGMRQRLGIAQALLGNPDLLVLDEPTNGLDPQGVQDMRSYLKKIVAEKNVSILISSHILTEIEKMCNRVMLLKDGVLTENIQSLLETKSKVVEYLFETDMPEQMVTFLKEKEFDVVEEDSSVVVQLSSKNISTVIKELLGADISFAGVTERKQSLEEQFIHIVGGNKK